MLRPDLLASDVAHVTLDWLRERGITCVLVDADDTLLPGDDGPLPATALEWLMGIQAAGLRLAILSNGSARRVHALGERLGVPSFALAGKPFGFAFQRALRALGATPNQAVMIGDQLFTDILGARWAGLHTALVRPLTAGRHAHTRVVRRLERWCLGGERAEQR